MNDTRISPAVAGAQIGRELPEVKGQQQPQKSACEQLTQLLEQCETIGLDQHWSEQFLDWLGQHCSDDPE